MKKTSHPSFVFLLMQLFVSDQKKTVYVLLCVFHI